MLGPALWLKAANGNEVGDEEEDEEAFYTSFRSTTFRSVVVFAVISAQSSANEAARLSGKLPDSGSGPRPPLRIIRSGLKDAAKPR
ncbi:uncharacterized protein V6R79_018361 [Siganus canaliculatus]